MFSRMLMMVVVHLLIYSSTAQNPPIDDDEDAFHPKSKRAATTKRSPPKYWHGGDWAMEALAATPDKIGVDGEWADYAHTLLWPDYEEDKRKLTTPKKAFTDLTSPDDWVPLAPTDVPYLALIYRRDQGPSGAFKMKFPDDPDPGFSHVEPTTACGGAFLTPSYVLTVCGCVFSMVCEAYDIPPIFTTSKRFPGYNIFDYEAGYRPELSVGSASGQFVADFYRTIDTDTSKWGGPGVNCREEIDLAKTAGRGTAEKSVFVNVGMILLPFNPTLKPNAPDFFPPWPPYLVNKNNDPNYRWHGSLISVGMRQTRPGKFVFFSSVSPSSIVLQHCDCDTFVCNKTITKRFGSKSACFKGDMNIYKLVGGVIGWPILGNNGTLVGLTSSERDPKDGTVLSTLMRPEIIQAIEKLLGRDKLINQNKPLPPYRAKDVPQKFQIYDYAFALKIRTKSECATNKPLDFVWTLAWSLIALLE